MPHHRGGSMKSEDFKAVIFRLGKEEFGIHIEQVVSIERMQSITTVPKLPKHVLGVIDLRGVVIPVVDLHLALMDENISVTDTTRIIVVSIDQGSVGLLVDAATDVLDIPANRIQPVEFIDRGGADFLKGVVNVNERLLMLLDVTKLLHNVTDMKQILQLEPLI
jgi:purine-binding chemotaxis protein CheW